MNNFPSRHMMVAATQTNGNKKKQEPIVGVMKILAAAVATKVFPQCDPKRKQLEYVSMKVESSTLYNMWKIMWPIYSSGRNLRGNSN